MGDDVRDVELPITNQRDLNFSPGFDIQAAIDKQLGKVPPDRTVAFVATAMAQSGSQPTVRMAVMVRQGNTGWSFAGYLEKEYKGDGRIGAELRYSK